MEGQYYDDASIAARSKREQLMKEAEEHRFRRHIAALHALEKNDKVVSPENRRKYVSPPGTKPHPAPGH